MKKKGVLDKIPQALAADVAVNLGQIRASLADTPRNQADDNKVLKELLETYIGIKGEEVPQKQISAVYRMLDSLKAKEALPNEISSVSPLPVNNSPYRTLPGELAVVNHDEIGLMLIRFQDFLANYVENPDIVSAATTFIERESKTWLEVAIIRAGVRDWTLLTTGKLKEAVGLVGLEADLGPILVEINSLLKRNSVKNFVRSQLKVLPALNASEIFYWEETVCLFCSVFIISVTLWAVHCITILERIQIIDVSDESIILTVVLTLAITTLPAFIVNGLLVAIDAYFNRLKSSQAEVIKMSELTRYYNDMLLIPEAAQQFVDLLLQIQSTLDLLKKEKRAEQINVLSAELSELTEKAKTLLAAKGHILKSKVRVQIPDSPSPTVNASALRMRVSDQVVAAMAGAAAPVEQNEEAPDLMDETTPPLKKQLRLS